MDGRLVIPLSLMYKGNKWQLEALVDTEATISIIAERELECFSELLKKQHHEVSPRGGYFRIIRIRKTNLSSPFQSKIAYAYYKANLELRIKLSDSESLVTYHTAYVMKKMNGSFILGADFLKHPL